MALESGVMAVTVEYAQGLKDKDWIGKQDPYVIIKCGGQTFRSRTAIDGGRNPVWGETFKFNVINDNAANITIMDEDNGVKDDFIGECSVSFARAREHGQDVLQVPVLSKKNKQRGFVSLKLAFTPNSAMVKPKPQPACAPPVAPAAPPAYAAPPAAYPAVPAAAPQHPQHYPQQQYPQYPQQPMMPAAAAAPHMAACQQPMMPAAAAPAYAMPTMPMAYMAVPIITMPNPFPAAKN